MSGSRANPPRYGDRSSFDALNRTIEGLEARIEGLMGTANAAATAPTAERSRRARDLRAHRRPARRSGRRDHAAPARARYRAASAPQRRANAAPHGLRQSPSAQHRSAGHAGGAPLCAAMPRRILPPGRSLRRSSACGRISSATSPTGLGREMDMLRAEMRAIRQAAEVRGHDDDIRGDLQRLAQGISQLGLQSGRSDSRRPPGRVRRTALGPRRPCPRGFRAPHGKPLERRGAEARRRRPEPRRRTARTRLPAGRTEDADPVRQPYARSARSGRQAACDGPGRRSARPQRSCRTTAASPASSRASTCASTRSAGAIAAGGRAPGFRRRQRVLQRMEGRIADLAGQLDTIAHRPVARAGARPAAGGAGLPHRGDGATRRRPSAWKSASTSCRR